MHATAHRAYTEWLCAWTSGGPRLSCSQPLRSVARGSDSLEWIRLIAIMLPAVSQPPQPLHPAVYSHDSHQLPATSSALQQVRAHCGCCGLTPAQPHTRRAGISHSLRCPLTLFPGQRLSPLNSLPHHVCGQEGDLHVRRSMADLRHELVVSAAAALPSGRGLVHRGLQEPGGADPAGRGQRRLRQRRLLPPSLPDHQDHVHPRQAGQQGGPHRHHGRLPQDMEGRRQGRRQDDMPAQQCQPGTAAVSTH